MGVRFKFAVLIVILIVILIAGKQIMITSTIRITTRNRLKLEPFRP